MAAALRGLLSSPLADRYELDVVPTYRDARPLPRLAVFCAALLRLVGWSVRRRGRIVHIHATVRGSMYRKATCALLAKGLRRRVVLHVHSGAGDVEVFGGSRGRFSLTLFRAAFVAADAVVAVSTASADAMRRSYRLGSEAIEVVPNAAPLVPRFVRPSAGEEVRVAYLGGFANPAKGGDTMLEAVSLALSREPRLRIALAGPGELPAAAASLVAANPAVEWVGWLDDGRKDELLRDCEVFALSSRSEGMPMALLEAMAYGMAIVATRVGGIPEVVDDGVEGLLISDGQPQALADALCGLASDAELRKRLGLAARRRVERLDAVEVADRLSSLYATLGNRVAESQ